MTLAKQLRVLWQKFKTELVEAVGSRNIEK